VAEEVVELSMEEREREEEKRGGGNKEHRMAGASG
jgi:hypothetical protein